MNFETYKLIVFEAQNYQAGSIEIKSSIFISLNNMKERNIGIIKTLIIQGKSAEEQLVSVVQIVQSLGFRKYSLGLDFFLVIL